MKTLIYLFAFAMLLVLFTVIIPDSLVSVWVTPTGDGEEGMNNFEFAILTLRLVLAGFTSLILLLIVRAILKK
ncbi:TPA: hypothetical protein ACPZNJ_004081 [Yersinia enterocolitica]|uniref:hypothetical protein n=1 Tax=Yersinia enterocolitica TaxID=630 RepID=UPI0028BA31EC|nr:hypothetical protein [Yersinia enterocolitica]